MTRPKDKLTEADKDSYPVKPLIRRNLYRALCQALGLGRCRQSTGLFFVCISTLCPLAIPKHPNSKKTSFISQEGTKTSNAKQYKGHPSKP